MTAEASLASTQTSNTRAEASAAPFVDVGDAGSIRTLTMARANSRNALSRGMIAALHREIDRASADTAIKVVVLAGEGPAFCAGHDMKELTAHRGDADHGRAFYAETIGACSDMMQAIVRSPKPFIAAVHAPATAAGAQLVATCDLAVAATSARFGTPGVNIGLFCSTPMVALSRNMARKHAMEMLLLGDLISAEDAARFGLVNRVVADGEAREEAHRLAAIIAGKSTVSIAIGKRAFYEQCEMPLADAYNYAADVMTRNMLEADAKEGIGAFIEKRAPIWPGPDDEGA